MHFYYKIKTLLKIFVKDLRIELRIQYEITNKNKYKKNIIFTIDNFPNCWQKINQFY